MEQGGKGGQIPFIKKLISRIHCSVCRARYKAEDIRILAHQDNSWLLSVQCSKCGTQGIIFAVVKEEEIRFDELTPEEVRKFKRMPPITADEVLDMYQFLRDFRGDFQELLGETVE